MELKICVFRKKFTETGHTFYTNEASSCFWKNSIFYSSIFYYKAKNQICHGTWKTKILQKSWRCDILLCVYITAIIYQQIPSGRAGDCQTFKIDEKFQNNRRLLWLLLRDCSMHSSIGKAFPLSVLLMYKIMVCPGNHCHLQSDKIQYLQN